MAAKPTIFSPRPVSEVAKTFNVHKALIYRLQDLQGIQVCTQRY